MPNAARKLPADRATATRTLTVPCVVSLAMEQLAPEKPGWQ